MSNSAAVAAVRSQLVELLSERLGLADVVVAYEPPAGHVDLQAAGSDTPAAIWMAGDASGQWQIESLRGPPLRFVETAEQTVVLQVLPADDSDRQADIEARLAAMVGEVVDQLAGDPTLGIGDDVAPLIQVLPAEYEWTAGRMDLGTEGAFAARCEMTLTIRADRC